MYVKNSLILIILFFSISLSKAQIIINHTTTDINKIPKEYIDKIQQSTDVFHFATRSHGMQITYGLQHLSTDANYLANISWQKMPNLQEPGLKMYVNMPNNNYVRPEDYWMTAEGKSALESVLANSEIKFTTWVWSWELWNEGLGPDNIVYKYLDSISSFERKFPNVKFIYQTNPAQNYDLNCWQYFARDSANKIIREYCIKNKKILFDFADIECWENGVENLDTCLDDSELHRNLIYQGMLPRYKSDEVGHTTAENALLKARAFWWLLARLQGWNDSSADINKGINDAFYIYPNPSSNSIRIKGLAESSSYEILNITGIQNVKSNFSSDEIIISHLQPGLYFLKITQLDGSVITKSFIKI